jgi:tetratricopeptide (TPR) repeat protein
MSRLRIGTSFSRKLRLIAGLVSISLFASTAALLWLANRDPENYGIERNGPGRVIGPSTEALNDAAEVRLGAGVDMLNDSSRSPVERIASYRDELRAAEELLERSLRVNPAQADTLVELAAIRWELSPPQGHETVDEYLQMVSLASRMAPRVPRVQLRLGRLLIAMGLRDEAVEYLHRTVQFSPDRAREVVELMTSSLYSAQEILDALPQSAEVVPELQRPFYLEGGEAAYRRALAGLLAGGEPRIVRRFGDTLLRMGVPGELLLDLEQIGSFSAPESEAVRLSQIARAHSVMGNHDRARAVIGDARRLDPDDPWLAEQEGDVALADGDPETAIRMYREALVSSATRRSSATGRAVLHRKIGQAEESRGRADRAYDSYRLALTVDPEEVIALRRLKEMEAAAGVMSLTEEPTR